MTTPSIPTRPRVLSSLAPTAVFLLVNWWLGVAAAIVGASVVSAVVIGYRWRTGQAIGWLLPLTLGYVAIRGTASYITGSEDVYFGFGIALSAVAAVAIAVAAIFGRPAAAFLIPGFVYYRREVLEHPYYLRVAAQVTVAWALMDLAITGWEAWHLTNVSAGEFVALRTFIGWPVMAIWIFFLIGYVRFRLDPLQWALTRDVPSLWGKGEYRR